MQKLSFATLFILLVTYTATAQLELNVGLNGTLTSFRGSDAAPFTTVYIYNSSGTLRRHDGIIYGTQKGVGWGLDFSLQKVTKKSGFLGGVSLGYERLVSRIRLGAANSGNPDAQGNTARLVHGFINIFPYIGKRFRLSKSKGMIDINLGSDIGLPVSSVFKAKEGSDSQEKPDLDLRPRLQVKWQHDRWGVLLGYSLGIYNYYGWLQFFGAKYAFSNVGRLGVFYQLPTKFH